MEFYVTKDELDYETAYRAYVNQSFHPDDRAKQDQESFAESLNSFYAQMKALVTTPEQKELLLSEMDQYKQNFLRGTLAILHVKSRCASPMITGPANFPVARNEKNNRVLMKRIDDFLEWDQKAKSSIEKKILALRPDEEKHNEALENLKKELIYFHAHNFPVHAAGMIQRKANRGDIELAKEALNFVKTLPGKPLFSSRNKVWKILELDQSVFDEQKKTGVIELFPFDGGNVLNNYDEERIQIFFEDIPSAETRSRLKSSGWKWSPKHKAWQRKNTPNAISSVKTLLS